MEIKILYNTAGKNYHKNRQMKRTTSVEKPELTEVLKANAVHIGVLKEECKIHANKTDMYTDRTRILRIRLLKLERAYTKLNHQNQNKIAEYKTIISEFEECALNSEEVYLSNLIKKKRIIMNQLEETFLKRKNNLLKELREYEEQFTVHMLDLERKATIRRILKDEFKEKTDIYWKTIYNNYTKKYKEGEITVSEDLFDEFEKPIYLEVPDEEDTLCKSGELAEEESQLPLDLNKEDEYTPTQEIKDKKDDWHPRTSHQPSQEFSQSHSQEKKKSEEYEEKSKGYSPSQ